MMTLADAYAILQSGTLWSSTGKCKGYAIQNPGEAKQIDAYVASLNKGQIVAPPALATKTGQGIVGMLAALAASSPAPIPPPPSATPVPVGALLFSEDFTSPLDLTKWDVKTYDRFLTANVSVHDGVLDIQATKDASGVWHGGEIQSLAPTYQYSGPRYMESRAKVPVGAGTWPGPLWEWAAPWGASGVENDVNETLGKEPTRYHATLHNGPSQQFGKTIDTGMDLSAAFHRYGCAMRADGADYYFDGQLVASISKAEALANGLSAWQFTSVPMVVLVDLDMGGSWAGPVTVTPPVHMLVDYVKVWALA